MPEPATDERFDNRHEHRRSSPPATPTVAGLGLKLTLELAQIIFQLTHLLVRSAVGRGAHPSLTRLLAVCVLAILVLNLLGLGHLIGAP